MATLIKGKVTNAATKRFFIPAMTIKLLGAIALGLIYQFYYGTGVIGGGDTFNYWYNGSYLYEAFFSDPSEALQLVFGDVNSELFFKYRSKIWLIRSDSAFFIVKLSAVIDLVTFHTYSATSLFFALFSFSGSWALFQILSKKYPESVRGLFFAIFLVPSMVIWSSGILKDSVTIGALFWLVWCVVRGVEFGKIGIVGITIFLFSLYLIFLVKFYVLMCLIPSLIIYTVLNYFSLIRSKILKVLMAPIAAITIGIFVFISIDRLGQESDSYRLESIAQKSKITAYDLRYGWGSSGGSGYSIGNHDGTWLGMIRLAPKGILAALFRPFLWEASSIFMLIAAVESFLILLLSVKALFKRDKMSFLSDPFLIFCLIFSIVFAFAVGISTFNFGSLSRYRIPLLPFFMIFVFLNSKKASAQGLMASK